MICRTGIQCLSRQASIETMILIDTNVVSELMRPIPAPAVLDWFGRQDATGLHPSAVGEAELRRRALILPAGRRRDRLIAEINALVRDDFGHRYCHSTAPPLRSLQRSSLTDEPLVERSASLTVRLPQLLVPTGQPLLRAMGGSSRDAGSGSSTRGSRDERRPTPRWTFRETEQIVCGRCQRFESSRVRHFSQCRR